MQRKVLSVAGVALLLVAILGGLGLFSNHSPTIDVLGSYFPAWMACIISGLALTLATHWIIERLRLKSFLGPGPLIYPCLMTIFTFLTWIVFYQN